MNSDESSVPDDPFVNSLAAYHQAISEGLSVDKLSPDIDPELILRLERARSCVRLLHEFWPSVEYQSQIENAPPVSPDLNSPSTVSEPIKWGRFEIERQLGQGAHGIVFLACDTLYRRKVALKIPRPEALLDEQLQSRFMREAETASLLNHPNLVRVYETGEIGPVWYIAQEYCPGSTLAAWLTERDGPVVPRAAADFIATLADAIDYAHRTGVLHRDLKPGNVILQPQSESDVPATQEPDHLPFNPKVADFGLAKLIEGAGNDTRSGMLLGTPLYMAPEQVEGRLEKIGPGTDIYGLGVILYELLTRRFPFHGKSTIETLRSIASDELAPPSRICGDVPSDLEAICLKCLEKDPSNRYLSAADLAKDLRRFLSGIPTRARPIRLGKRFYKFICHHPALSGFLIMGVLGVIALSIGGWWHAARMQNLLTEVVRQREEAVRQGDLARDRELRVRQYHYASDMKRAYAAWNHLNAAETVNLLERYQQKPDEIDVRSFPWYYLWRLTHSEKMTLHGHQRDVHGLAFFTDGRKLATASHDGTAKIWDATTGKVLLTLLEGHNEELNSIAISHDGKVLATGSDDRAVRLWNTLTGSQIAILSGHSQSIYAVAFSPDGKTLASGGPDNVVKLWDVATGGNLASLDAHSGAIESISFSPDGTLLASASGDGTAILWDLSAGKPRFHLKGHENVVRAVAFKGDNRVLATGSDDRSVKVWETVSGREMASLTDHGEVVQCVEFSPDGRTLAAAIKDGTVKLWDLESLKPVQTIQGHTGRVWHLSYSSDGKKLATASGDSTVKIWAVPEILDVEQRTEITGSLLTLAILSPETRQATFAAVSNESEFRIGKFDSLRRNGEHRVLSRNEGATRAAAFAPNGRNLAVAFTVLSSSGDSMLQLRLFDVDSGNLQKVLNDGRSGKGKAYSSSCIAYSSDLRWIALGRDDGTIDLWNMNDTQGPNPLIGHTDSVNALSFSPDSTTLVSVGEDQTVRFWNVDDLSEKYMSRRHRSGVSSLAFAPDGHLMATAGKDRTIVLWDPGTATILATLQSQGAPVQTVAFSQEGKVLVTGALDGTLKIWDIPTRQEVMSWQAHENAVVIAAFSADGKLLVSGGNRPSGNSEVAVWKAD